MCTLLGLIGITTFSKGRHRLALRRSVIGLVSLLFAMRKHCLPCEVCYTLGSATHFYTVSKNDTVWLCIL